MNALANQCLHQWYKVRVSREQRGSSDLPPKSMSHHVHGKPNIYALLSAVLPDNFAERNMYSIKCLELSEPFVFRLDARSIDLLPLAVFTPRNRVVVENLVE